MQPQQVVKRPTAPSVLGNTQYRSQPIVSLKPLQDCHETGSSHASQMPAIGPGLPCRTPAGPNTTTVSQLIAWTLDMSQFQWDSVQGPMVD